MVDELSADALLRRSLLRRRGVTFCDDNPPATLKDHTLERRWSATSCGLTSLIDGCVEASSTDHVTQSIDNTLHDNRQFWSSGPSQHQHEQECLVYKLASSACHVRFVQLAVYRETMQQGSPIYPPLEISFGIGSSPARLATVTPRYPVERTQQTQTFPLPASVPLGSFLRVELHGKAQLQLEDMRYYIAIRLVRAFGDVLPPTHVAKTLHRLFHSHQGCCVTSFSPCASELLPEMLCTTSWSGRAHAADTQDPMLGTFRCLEPSTPERTAQSSSTTTAAPDRLGTAATSAGTSHVQPVSIRRWAVQLDEQHSGAATAEQHRGVPTAERARDEANRRTDEQGMPAEAVARDPQPAHGEGPRGGAGAHVALHHMDAGAPGPMQLFEEGFAGMGGVPQRFVQALMDMQVLQQAARLWLHGHAAEGETGGDQQPLRQVDDATLLLHYLQRAEDLGGSQLPPALLADVRENALGMASGQVVQLHPEVVAVLLAALEVQLQQLNRLLQLQHQGGQQAGQGEEVAGAGRVQMVPGQEEDPDEEEDVWLQELGRRMHQVLPDVAPPASMALRAEKVGSGSKPDVSLMAERAAVLWGLDAQEGKQPWELDDGVEVWRFEEDWAFLQVL